MLERVTWHVQSLGAAMAVRITRRDFLSGIAVGAGTSLLAPADLLAQVDPTAPGDSSVYYPPTRPFSAHQSLAHDYE